MYTYEFSINVPQHGNCWMKLESVTANGVYDMTSIGMTSHCMTSCYGVHFWIECVNRPVLKTWKVSIRYASWFTRYSITLIIFRMTLVYNYVRLYWFLFENYAPLLTSWITVPYILDVYISVSIVFSQYDSLILVFYDDIWSVQHTRLHQNHEAVDCYINDLCIMKTALSTSN